MGFVAPQNLGSSWTGIESVSPALVGRFFTTEPLGSPIAFFFMTDIPLSVCVCTHTPHLHLSGWWFFFLLSCMSSFYVLYCNPLSDILFANVSLPFSRLPFCFVGSLLCCAKAF